MKTTNAVVWFEIYVQDMDRAKKFYEKVFDVKLEDMSSPDESEMASFPMADTSQGAYGALVKMKDVASGGSGTMVYFGCEDCTLEESRVAEAGGEVQQSKFQIGEHGFISVVEDTEGNMFGLYSNT